MYVCKYVGMYICKYVCICDHIPLAINTHTHMCISVHLPRISWISMGRGLINWRTALPVYEGVLIDLPIMSSQAQQLCHVQETMVTASYPSSSSDTISAPYSMMYSETWEGVIRS